MKISIASLSYRPVTGPTPESTSSSEQPSVTTTLQGDTNYSQDASR